MPARFVEGKLLLPFRIRSTRLMLRAISSETRKIAKGI
jgi:hypothetical protein